VVQATAVPYATDGHLVVRGAVDEATVSAARRHCDELADRHPGSAILTAPLDADPFLTRVVGDTRLLAIAADALDGEPVPFGATYLVKPPRTGLPVLWHQDGHPWREHLGITDAVTLWLALDDATVESGCLRVVPGSHRMEAQPLRPNVAEPNVFGHEIERALVDEARAVDVALAPGDVSVHHPNLVHGSGPNRSDRLRGAGAVRYRSMV
jgi:phytanoyl-CoA hydroxylase